MNYAVGWKSYRNQCDRVFLFCFLGYSNTCTAFPRFWWFLQVFDTRCFHKLGDQFVYRERTQHLATFSSLRKRGLSTDPSAYSSADAALPVLELSEGSRILEVCQHNMRCVPQMHELVNFTMHVTVEGQGDTPSYTPRVVILKHVGSFPPYQYRYGNTKVTCFKLPGIMLLASFAL